MGPLRLQDLETVCRMDPWQLPVLVTVSHTGPWQPQVLVTDARTDQLQGPEMPVQDRVSVAHRDLGQPRSQLWELAIVAHKDQLAQSLCSQQYQVQEMPGLAGSPSKRSPGAEAYLRPACDHAGSMAPSPRHRGYWDPRRACRRPQPT